MFSGHSSAAAPLQVGTKISVISANPHKLVVLLFDGAIAALTTARGHMARRELVETCVLISKAIEIIEDGLRASLDLSHGGELAYSLAMLYTDMTARLVKAELHNDLTALEEVATLLKELRDAWVAIETPRQMTDTTPSNTSIASSFIMHMQGRVKAAIAAGEAFTFAEGEREFLAVLCELAQKNGMPPNQEAIARELGLLA